MKAKNEFIDYIKQRIDLPITSNEKNLLSKYLVEDTFQSLQGENDFEVLNSFISRLNSNEPLQYITNQAHFLDYIFYVDNHVLIPRPETEELVLKAIDCIKENNLLSILDIGTGSGCIPISIKKKFPTSKVTAIDVDTKALNVAKKNADKYDVVIEFIASDFLDEKDWEQLSNYDLIISNPPYISIDEKKEMKGNVLNFEPHRALFAGEDALLFYRKIAKFSKLHNPTAIVISELNEYFTMEIKELFSEYAQVEILQDLQGKNRILVAK